MPAVEPSEDDFLAFWKQHRDAKAPPETKRILGVDVVVPTDLPLSFEEEARQLADSEDRADFEQLLEVLFGHGTLQAWQENGLTSGQLRVLMTWGMTNASGKPTTFAEAAALVAKAEKLKAEAEGDGEGKAPNRAARRASSATRASAGTGRASSRTSAASTKSTRKR